MDNVFFLIMGIVLTVIGIIYPVLSIRRRVSCKAKIKATVISVEKKKHYNGDKTVYKYLPTFFYTVNSKEYTVKSDLETMNRLKYKKNDEVIIRYNPDYPEQISVGVKVFPYVLGVVFILFGVALVYSSF